MNLDRDGANPLSAWRWILPLVFVLLGGSVLSDLAHYRGDEHFYSDAALEMLRSGDYLTPKFEDGADRFNKPILNYWLIAASYQLFGTGVFATRLPALLSGAGLIWLMWPLARALFDDRRVALVSMGMMACNHQVMGTSIRATTDVVLVCFLTLSLAGLARLVVQGRRDAGGYAMFYFGAALAVLTKGGWGLMPILLGYGLIAAFGRRWGMRARDLIHWPILLGAAIVALSWFILIAAAHGPSALGRFFADQAGGRFGAGEAGATRWKNVLVYSTGIPLQLMPWSILAILLAIGCRPAMRALTATHRKTLVMIAAWSLMTLVPLLIANIVRPRYVLILFPMLTPLLAAGILSVVDRRADIDLFLRRLIPRLLGVAAVLAALFALWCLQIDARLVGSGSLVALICLAGACASRRRSVSMQMLISCLAILLCVRAHQHLGYQVFASSPIPQMARPVLAMPIGSRVGMAEELDLDEQMRMYLGLDYVVETIPAGETTGQILDRSVSWLRADDPRIDIAYLVQPTVRTYRKLRNRHLTGTLLRPGRREKILAECEVEYAAMIVPDQK